MRTFGIRAALVALLVAGIAFVVMVRADEVSPASLVVTNLRTTASSGNYTDTVYYQGDTISFSNSVMYTGADTNSAVQNLEGCAITVTMGQPGNTNVTTASGSAISTNDGTWTASIECAAFNPCYIEVTVSNNAIFTYPRYRITTQAKLGE
jgi:hypothetical protein